MKKRNYMTAGRWMAAAVAALALGACSQGGEETAEALPDGKYPLELTATGLQAVEAPVTRATVDGNWDGGADVAVKVGTEVRKYTVAPDDADNTKGTLTSDNPFYWKSTADITVSAWAPYTDGAAEMPALELVADQSTEAKYEAGDWIAAAEQTVAFGTQAELAFAHRTAKLSVQVVDGSGNGMAADGVEVMLDGTAVKPCLRGGAYLCLLPPAALEAGKLAVRITVDGAAYVYTHAAALAMDANRQYSFRLTVRREGVELGGCTISPWDATPVIEGEATQPSYDVDAANVWHIYSADGLKAWAAAVSVEVNGDVSAILENDIEMPAPAAGEESNWEPVYNRMGFCGTFDGNGKTITGLVVSVTNGNAGFINNTGENGTVKNLTLKDARIKGDMSVGAVVARHSSRGKVENCRVTGASVIEADGGNYAGGVVGDLNNQCTILACSVAKECEVKGPDRSSNSSTSPSCVGGIVGSNKGGSVVLCYALCKLTGTFVGGICGKSITKIAEGTASYSLCYSKCQYSILGSGSGYGIIGKKDGDPNLSNCCYSGADTAVKDAADGSAVKKVSNEQDWLSDAVSSFLLGQENSGYKYQKTAAPAEPYVIVTQ